MIQFWVEACDFLLPRLVHFHSILLIASENIVILYEADTVHKPPTEEQNSLV